MCVGCRVAWHGPLQVCLRDDRWEQFQLLSFHVGDALQHLSDLRDRHVLATQQWFNQTTTDLTVRHSYPFTPPAPVSSSVLAPCPDTRRRSLPRIPTLSHSFARECGGLETHCPIPSLDN
jgi:hypothetical protein